MGLCGASVLSVRHETLELHPQLNQSSTRPRMPSIHLQSYGMGYNYSMVLPAALQTLISGCPLERVVSADVEAAIDQDLSELLLGEILRQGTPLDKSLRMRLEAKRLGNDHVRAGRMAALIGLRRNFERCGVPLRLFKGYANAVLLYDDPRERLFSDADVLVGVDGETELPALFNSLGIHPVASEAAISLWSSGTAVHELDGSWDGLLVDLHFTPYGLLAPLRSPAPIAAEMHMRDLPQLGGVLVPSAELGLLIATINLAKNGGAALWTAVDIVRFLEGRAGPIDWNHYRELATLDGLLPISAQVLYALSDDLGLREHIGVDRPETRAMWAPTLGEDPMVGWSLRRHWSLLVLRRPRAFRSESLKGLARWYLRPPHVLSVLRPDLEGPYWIRWAKMQVDRAEEARGRNRNAL